MNNRETRYYRAGFFALLGVLLVVGLLWALPQAKRAYWKAYSTAYELENHGSRVIRSVPEATPYDRWLELAKDEIPMLEGLVVPDISTVELGSWPQLGDDIKGLYLRFADYQITDGRIVELPANGATRPRSHLFEMGVYVLNGNGHTLFSRDGQPPLRLDWQPHSLFSVPLNVEYQHFNDGDTPLRLLAVTSFPFAINSVDNLSFVIDNPYVFDDRFDGNPGFFGSARRLRQRLIRTNFVADALTAELDHNAARGKGKTNMHWSMAGNRVLGLHVSEIPAHSFAKAHRHSSDAFILLLNGEGYSLIWSGDDMESRQRIDWRKNTLFVPPTFWYHQHFNSGTEASRYLAINAPHIVRDLGLRFADQIEENLPEIQAEWEASAGTHGHLHNDTAHPKPNSMPR